MDCNARKKPVELSRYMDRSNRRKVSTFWSRYNGLFSLLYIGFVSATVILFYLLSPAQYEVSAVVSLLSNERYDVHSQGVVPPQPGQLARVAIALFESENVVR